MFVKRQKAYLLLENGKRFEGFSFGAKGSVIGEIVFATGMTGYEETLTDPSYYGQIVTQTFPLIGNYGVNKTDRESKRCYLSGYIVREWCELPSNFRCEGEVDAFLKEQKVIGLCGVDTRELTRIIRESGVMNGMISTEPITDEEAALAQIKAYVIENAVKSVSVKQSEIFPAEGEERFHAVLMDFGYKFNIRRELCARGCKVTVVPYDTTAKEIKELSPDGIMLSNGPGDPAENVEVISNLQEILRLNIPVFGICLGHQLSCLALGGRTEKLKYGHRGANQPVIDLKTGKTYVTSQNHGYAVVGDSIPETVGKVSHINANDGTCEGVVYSGVPVETVQFHPEACGGPHDTAYLFDRFVSRMEAYKAQQH